LSLLVLTIAGPKTNILHHGNKAQTNYCQKVRSFAVNSSWIDGVPQELVLSAPEWTHVGSSLGQMVVATSSIFACDGEWTTVSRTGGSNILTGILTFGTCVLPFIKSVTSI
jgi:hypothetical protein